MFRIAVCDDQEQEIEEISKYIENYVQTTGIQAEVKKYEKPVMLVDDVEDGKCFDIIFIDIEMPGMSGMEAISKIKAITPYCLIVIVSAYQQYAISAIELEVFRYLVKGKLDSVFDRCMDAAMKRLRVENQNYYIISSERKKNKILCSDILYCSKDGKMVLLHTKNGVIRERKTLQALQHDLGELCNHFIAVERGYIINMNYVTKIEKSEIILEQEIRLPIGGTYLAEVRKQINDFWRGQL